MKNNPSVMAGECQKNGFVHQHIILKTPKEGERTARFQNSQNMCGVPRVGESLYESCCLSMRKTRAPVESVKSFGVSVKVYYRGLAE